MTSPSRQDQVGPEDDGPASERDGRAPRPVLYLVACGSPPAAGLHDLVELVLAARWDVHVLATPRATALVDAERLVELTGHPVRSEADPAGDDGALPPPDAMVVAPATFNTINKWAAGIADHYAASVLCEQTGLDVPTVVAPNVSPALARHPAFRQSLHRLWEWGARILFQPSAPPPTWMAPWERIARELTAVPKAGFVRQD